MHQVDLLLPDIANGEDKSSALANRIRKNYRLVKKWAKKHATNCFRIYDKEIPGYPLAIDFYNGRFCVHYFSRANDQSEPPLKLAEEAVSALCTIFETTPEAIFWRTRSKSKSSRQYEKIGETQEFFSVMEYGNKFWINLTDYLDTGLFLDHRETRRLVASECQGKRVLNLFAYTCSFSVYAAAAGASFTKSVDMSNTYTNWGSENFKINGLSLARNSIVRADCLKFLDEELKSGLKYDVIIIDPPTISRSKKMDQLFSIQTDYVSLISKAMKMLEENGLIFFSTNSRKFAFESCHFPGLSAVDISHKTIPLDFHDPKIHRCWKLTNTPS